MKNSWIVVIMLFFLFSKTFAQHYSPVEQNGAVQFKVVSRMLFKNTITGSFSGIKGTIVFNPKNLTKSIFNVSVDAATINTGMRMRDKDLKKEKYFNIAKYPLIAVKSASIIKSANDNEYVFSGMLEMKGISKPVSFPFTAINQNGEYVFKGNFTINRSDFNIGPDNDIDKDVIIDLNITAK